MEQTLFPLPSLYPVRNWAKKKKKVILMARVRQTPTTAERECAGLNSPAPQKENKFPRRSSVELQSIKIRQSPPRPKLGPPPPPGGTAIY